MVKKNNSDAKQSKHVLVVEDDQALRDAFGIILTKEGYQVDTSNDGKDALDFLSSNDTDLILLDLLMPEVDGKEFLRRFNNKKDVPIIIFSNLDNQTDINEALELGATRFMLKAWSSPKELGRIIQDTLKS